MMKTYVAEFINNELVVKPYQFKITLTKDEINYRNIKLKDIEILNLIEDYRTRQYSVKELLKKYDISKTTMYKYLKKETKCPINLNTLLG